MKTKLPWILCIVLTALLLITNWSVLSNFNTEIPAELAELGEDANWTHMYQQNNFAIWKIPAYGPPDCRHGESYALIHNKQLFAMFSESGPSVAIYQNGQTIADMPLRNTLHSSMRRFHFDNEKGYYNLIDYNGDGLIDIKSGGGQAWIYQHGQFLEVDYSSYQKREKRLLDGITVILKDGKWVETDE